MPVQIIISSVWRRLTADLFTRHRDRSPVAPLREVLALICHGTQGKASDMDKSRKSFALHPVILSRSNEDL